MSSAFVNPLQRRAPGLVEQARAIKQWTRACLALPDEKVVSVNELTCHIPGCPPKETVIVVMGASGTMQASIHKALADICEADVTEAGWTEPGSQDPARGG
ncbi:MAG TPA: hypothetical protein VN112_24990 [Ensifer sp.]|nr:hypothetical protein [Ensifer sp.]